MLEVEVKVELLAPGALRDRLKAAGAVAHPVEEHRDVFFAHPERDFVETDEALRLRRVNERTLLTYKGPKSGGDVKIRTEHETVVESDPTDLLRAIGFVPTFGLTKQREPWELDGTHVTIDTIDGLGTFAEVEVLGEDADAATLRVETVLKGLGLSGATRHTASYVEMARSSGIGFDF